MIEPKDLEEINTALNLKVMTEVEKRAHEWLVKAQGVDWAEKFETLARQNVNLKLDVDRAIDCLSAGIDRAIITRILQKTLRDNP